MSFRSFLWLTVSTLPGCLLLILFLDQPLAWFIHNHVVWVTPFFAAFTAVADEASLWLLRPGWFWLVGGSLIGFLLVRVVLRRTWGNVFLLLLPTFVASVMSTSLLQQVFHRLRPEVLFTTGYHGAGFWQQGPNNHSFPSAHTATYVGLFWPLVIVFPRYRVPLLVGPAVVALGRLILDQHYLSDIWFAGWLAIAWGELFRGVGRAATLLCQRGRAKKHPLVRE